MDMKTWMDQVRKKLKNRKSQVVIELRLMGLSYVAISELLKISEGQIAWLCQPSEQTKQEVYLRSGRKCEVCGKSPDIGHVHHRMTERSYTVPTKAMVDNFNKVENLIYLCHSCHSKMHAQ